MMKKIIQIGVLALGLIVLFSSCNSTSTKDAKTEKEGAQNNTGQQAGSSMKIAFYYQDSIATQFDFYREVDSIVKHKELNFQKELESKMRAYQKYRAELQKRYQNNEITGYQIDDIKKTIAKKEQSIQMFKQQKGGELQRKVMQYQVALMNKISAAAKEFSKEKGIDLLLYYQEGGQITYVNGAYNVTDQFMDYLNQREDELRSGFKKEVDAINVDSLDNLKENGLNNGILNQ